MIVGVSRMRRARMLRLNLGEHLTPKRAVKAVERYFEKSNAPRDGNRTPEKARISEQPVIEAGLGPFRPAWLLWLRAIGNCHHAENDAGRQRVRIETVVAAGISVNSSRGMDQEWATVVRAPRSVLHVFATAHNHRRPRLAKA